MVSMGVRLLSESIGRALSAICAIAASRPQMVVRLGVFGDGEVD
jgi:hypothetical protein